MENRKQTLKKSNWDLLDDYLSKFFFGFSNLTRCWNHKR